MYKILTSVVKLGLKFHGRNPLAFIQHFEKLVITMQIMRSNSLSNSSLESFLLLVND